MNSVTNKVRKANHAAREPQALASRRSRDEAGMAQSLLPRLHHQRGPRRWLGEAQGKPGRVVVA